MDPRRFDSLARALAGAKSRRGFLGGIATLAAGLAGARSVEAQVSQAQCGNKSCKNNPGKCNDGCVCCVWGNGNSRCRPPGNCADGAEVCPPGQVVDPVLGCVTPATTTTAAPTTTTAAPTTTTTAAPTTTTTTTTTTPSPCAGVADGVACGTGMVCVDGACAGNGVCATGAVTGCHNQPDPITFGCGDAACGDPNFGIAQNACLVTLEGGPVCLGGITQAQACTASAECPAGHVCTNTCVGSGCYPLCAGPSGARVSSVAAAGGEAGGSTPDPFIP